MRPPAQTINKMSKKNPSSMTDEEKLEGLKKSGRMGDEPPEAPAPEVPPKKPEETPAPAPETPPAAPSTPAPKVEPPLPPTPKETPLAGDPQPVVAEHPTRPVKYIPLDKYQAEKAETQKEITARDERIKELEALVNKPAGNTTADIDTFVTKFAEKYAIDEEDVRGLVDVAKAGAVPKDLAETLNKITQDNAQKAVSDALLKDIEFFEKEWSGLEPTLKAEFPNATPEQLKAAKDALNTFGHTDEFVNKELDYVLYKKKGEIAALFGGAPADPTPPGPKPRKTVESGRPTGNQGVLTAADFKDKKTFDEFNDMEPSQVNQIIKDMDLKTYQRFTAWASEKETAKGLVVNRKGQQVRLN